MSWQPLVSAAAPVPIQPIQRNLVNQRRPQRQATARSTAKYFSWVKHRGAKRNCGLSAIAKKAKVCATKFLSEHTHRLATLLWQGNIDAFDNRLAFSGSKSFQRPIAPKLPGATHDNARPVRHTATMGHFCAAASPAWRTVAHMTGAVRQWLRQLLQSL